MAPAAAGLVKVNSNGVNSARDKRLGERHSRLKVVQANDRNDTILFDDGGVGVSGSQGVRTSTCYGADVSGSPLNTRTPPFISHADGAVQVALHEGGNAVVGGAVGASAVSGHVDRVGAEHGDQDRFGDVAFLEKALLLARWA